MVKRSSDFYDDEYWAWQKNIAQFGAWANRTKFDAHIEPSDDVLDFGCGGGLLLKGFQCRRRVGVEVNPAAAETARRNGLDVYRDVDDVPRESIDVVISNHALEHTLHPLIELEGLYKVLRADGDIVFVVPCEAVSYSYRPRSQNRHLYSWSPMCLGNLFSEAGFSVISCRPYIHKWPPNYRTIARIGGRHLFDLVCRIYGRIERSWFQVKLVGRRE